ncbi:MAG TPA: class D sortase [Bryobacteraceae bacterium]|nr:class D sortase [Bryobacteraceae bacterium]
MRIVIRHNSLWWLLRWIKRGLFAGAVGMLGYCCFVLVDGWIFQNQERRQLERLLRDRLEAKGGIRAAAYSASPEYPATAVTAGLIGRLEIPRLGLTAIVIEGTGKGTLRRAVGHIPGTALPGQPSNVGLSGHRDTFFRPLRNIRRDDAITITTLHGEYHYRVVSTKVVSPADVAVLNPSKTEILTLVTCYPFYFVGSAPQRFIVRAERVGTVSTLTLPDRVRADR